MLLIFSHVSRLVDVTASVASFSVSGLHDSAEEQLTTGSMRVNSSALALVHSPLLAGYNDSQLLVGVVFPSVGVPRGAKITRVHCWFVIDDVRPGSDAEMNLLIYGERTGNAARPSSEPADLSSRPHTSAAVEWAPNRSLGVNDSLRTVDVSPVLQASTLYLQLALSTPHSPVTLFLASPCRRLSLYRAGKRTTQSQSSSLATAQVTLG